MKNIIWLASYPKSGNTWCRVFLTNLLRNRDKPADINNLDTDGIASARPVFDEVTGIEASNLTFEEIQRLRPEVADVLSAESDEPRFIKIHDAYTRTPSGRWLVPSTSCRGVIYLLRNPLDVAVSLAHHSHSDLDKTIKRLGNPGFTAGPVTNRIYDQLSQVMMSWSRHVLSWVDAVDLQVHVMRYEDMVKNTLEAFLSAARYAGLPVELDRVQRALEFSDFNELKRQEEERGFHEKPARAEAFFRKGRIGSWREILNDEQVRTIINDHRDVMKRFGYLTSEGEPVF